MVELCIIADGGDWGGVMRRWLLTRIGSDRAAWRNNLLDSALPSFEVSFLGEGEVEYLKDRGTSMLKRATHASAAKASGRPVPVTLVYVTKHRVLVLGLCVRHLGHSVKGPGGPSELV